MSLRTPTHYNELMRIVCDTLTIVDSDGDRIDVPAHDGPITAESLKNFKIEVDYEITKWHMEGDRRIIDEMHLLGASLVPKERK